MRLPPWFPILLLAAPLAAQAPPPWKATLDRTLTADEADLSKIGQVLLLPSGELAVSQDQDGVVRFFGKSAKPVAVFGHTGAGPGEFQSERWLGTQNGTLWIEDVQLKRITFVSPAHKLIKTVREPASLTYHGAAISFSVAFVQGVAPDGSLLVAALRGMKQPRPAWATEAQWDGMPFLRVDTTGAILSTMAWVPRDGCHQNVEGTGIVMSFATPFCASPLHAFAGDGSVIVLVQADQVKHTYHVWEMTLKGDTAFSKTFSYKPVAYPSAKADSMVERYSTAFAKHSLKIPSYAKPDGYPPFDHILIGQDGTIWLGEYLSGASRTWRVLDKAGNLIGAMVLPGEVDVQVADRTQLFGIARDKDGDERVVHYTLARGSASDHGPMR